MSAQYGSVCAHARLERINKDFVRCLQCGQSIVSQVSISGNKSSNDFARENKSFTRNFDRNFSNVIEEVSEPKGPIYEYYSDVRMVNLIIINRRVQFKSDPAKYEVDVNGDVTYLTQAEISKLLADINARQLSVGQIPERLRKN